MLKADVNRQISSTLPDNGWTNCSVPSIFNPESNSFENENSAGMNKQIHDFPDDCKYCTHIGCFATRLTALAPCPFPFEQARYNADLASKNPNYQGYTPKS